MYVLFIGPKKKDSCVQVSEVKKIRVGRSKNIFILDFFFITNLVTVQRLKWKLQFGAFHLICMHLRWKGGASLLYISIVYYMLKGGRGSR